MGSPVSQSLRKMNPYRVTVYTTPVRAETRIATGKSPPASLAKLSGPAAAARSSVESATIMTVAAPPLTARFAMQRSVRPCGYSPKQNACASMACETWRSADQSCTRPRISFDST
eukprot:Amastigsp_a852441_2.p4 type:complete len:115 gc:universal Amastigsp_a852441_2:349-5(-)